MDLKKYEQKYYELKGKHGCNVISDAEYEKEIKALKIKDSNGDWCRIDEATGQWQVFNGDEWVKKQPFLGPVSQDDVRSDSEPASETRVADEESEIDYEDLVEYVETYEDDPDDYLTDPNELQGKMKELAEVDFSEEVRALMVNASDKSIFDDEDLSTYEISRNPNFYDDQTQMMKTDALTEADETAKQSISGSGPKTIIPTVTGKPPEITSEMLSMFGAAKAVKSTVTAAKKVKKAYTENTVKRARTEESAAQNICSKCSTPLKPGQKFCTKCGTSVEQKPPKGQCHKCGAENRENSKFCKMCGTKLNG